MEGALKHRKFRKMALLLKFLCEPRGWFLIPVLINQQGTITVPSRTGQSAGCRVEVIRDDNI